MQKPATDIKKKILPHHVIQLQCIIDAFTVSRGWSLNVLWGHVIEPPDRQFRPRRDVDLFLDRNNEREMSGVLNSISVLKQVLAHNDVLDVVSGTFKIAKDIQDDFINWLGESKYMYGLNGIPPSRFFNSNSNGLWEFSPFLCGVGLMEGLELTYRSSMMLWDAMPEPVLIVHLHNMLVKKGYITRPVGLFQNLQNFFATPSSSTGKCQSRISAVRWPIIPMNEACHAVVDSQVEELRPKPRAFIPSWMSVQTSFSTKNSNLLLYREAGWDLDRIPDNDLHPQSLLGSARILQTKFFIDPVTGKKRLPDTGMIVKLKAKVPTVQDEDIIAMGAEILRLVKDQQPIAKSLESLTKNSGYKLFSDARFKKKEAEDRKHINGLRLHGLELLELVKIDLYNDICGEHEPLSAVNYIWVTTVCLMQFMKIEDELKALRNPLYVRAYETDREWSKLKRAGLVTLALFEENEECLQVMVEQFQSFNAGIMNHIYWEDLHPVSELLNRPSRQDSPDIGCTIL